ncbi:MAG TPA: SigE family RNA polymerase sigma factor [Actinomycetota bacterium]
MTETTPLSVPRDLETIATSADFEAFFHAQRPRLLGSMILITGSSFEAEDLVQEAFFKVWERWDRVGAMDDPTGYLFRTALNAHRSAYRRAVRATRRALAPPPAIDPFDAVAERDEILRALGAMTPRQRAAVVLTELHGYGVDEAARALRIRPGTVRVLVSKGRASLRSRTEPDDE